MVYKDKLWIKFKDLDIVCFCAYNERKCPLEKKDCHLYLAKFIRIDDIEKHEQRVSELSSATKRLERRLKQEHKKFETEIQRSIKKMKNFKI